MYSMMKLINIVCILLQIQFGKSNLTLSKKEVIFYLYSRQLPGPQIIDEENITFTGASAPFKFIIHGFKSNIQNEWIVAMKNAYLKKADYNVITVDWKTIAETNLLLYLDVVKQLPKVADNIEKFILKLQEKGVNLKNIHLIGHSLGAHVAGLTGKSVAKKGKKIRRITGLDPAEPGFDYLHSHNRINKGDAGCVDIIHTSLLGLQYSCGDSDFYVSGGLYQHGCMREHVLHIFNFTFVGCCHTRACLYFTESINSNRFIATKCSNYVAYKSKQCTSNPTTTMGENVIETTKGDFHLNTNESPPFATNGI